MAAESSIPLPCPGSQVIAERPTINRPLVEKLARVAAGIPLNEASYLPDGVAGLSREMRLLAWLYSTGICQQTRNFIGIVGAREYRGSDYLTRRMIEHMSTEPEFWKPASLLDLEDAKLAAIFSDDRTAATSCMDRLEERARQLRDLADFIVWNTATSIEDMFPPDEPLVVEEISERLAMTEAYSDPLAKKTNLLLMVLVKEGLLKLSNPRSLRMPIDYHLMRVFLRTGVLVFSRESDLEQRLVRHQVVTSEEETAIRKACVEAGRIFTEFGADLFHLDALLWNIGRNCCQESGLPLCRLDRTCPKKPDRCTLIDGFHYDCPNKCPFNEHCHTATGEKPFLVHAPRFETHFY